MKKTQKNRPFNIKVTVLYELLVLLTLLQSV